MTISLYNNLAIQMYPQPLNNLPVKRYGAIFRHVREDFLDITTRLKTHCMGLNLKYWFCQSIKRSHKKLNYYALGMIPRDCNSFLKTLLIQVAKLVSPSFIASSSNCCRNSSVNRIWYCGDLFSFGVDMVITQYYYNYTVKTIIMVAPQKTIAQRVHTSMSYLTTNIKWSNAMANRYDSAHLRAEQSKLFKFYDLSIIDKNRLHEFQNLGYINLALAKSSVRIETLFILLATHDALSVFFCVNTCARLFIKSFSMVALVGQPKGWLVSSRASSLNPANVTANEIETSSGDYLNNYLLEAVIMTTTPNPIVSTQKLFKFYDLSTAQVIQTTATTEREARKSLGKQSLIFIARIRLTPIIERARTWGGYSHE